MLAQTLDPLDLAFQICSQNRISQGLRLYEDTRVIILLKIMVMVFGLKKKKTLSETKQKQINKIHMKQMI